MSNEIEPLTNEWGQAQEWRFGDAPIRTILRNGDPWFVLTDVGRVLGLTQPSRAASRLKEHERHTLTLTPGIRAVMPEIGLQVQSLIVISESGFYRLVMRSDKPVADAFQTWATEVVFPAIRKTGSYSAVPAVVAPAIPADPAAAMMELLRDPTRVLGLIGDYATRLIAADARVEHVAMQRDEIAQKADALAAAHDRFASHDGTFSITIAAKTLNLQPSRLFEWLAKNQWIYRPGGRGEWAAYQNRIHQGVLTMATNSITLAGGSTQEVSRVRVTTKGLARIALALELPAPAESVVPAE